MSDFAPLSCHRCGSGLSKKDKVCPSCGTPVDGSMPVAAPAPPASAAAAETPTLPWSGQATDAPAEANPFAAPAAGAAAKEDDPFAAPASSVKKESFTYTARVVPGQNSKEAIDQLFAKAGADLQQRLSQAGHETPFSSDYTGGGTSNDTLALIFALSVFVFLGPIGAVCAIVFARKSVRQLGHRTGKATFALIVGWLGVIGFLIIFLLALLGALVGGSSS